MAGRYFVETFGCRVNQADSAGTIAGLDPSLRLADSASEADVVVLNTCTVTHRSDADVRKSVRRIQRENPKARIIVTGCYAQRDPEGAKALGVAAVVGTAHRSRLPVLVERYQDSPPAETEVFFSEIDRVDPALLPPVDPVSTVTGKTRPFVKIQDGCDAYCSYCIIPSVRGRGRSAAPSKVEAAVQTLIQDGYQEVVIAGVHLGRYGLGPGSDITLDRLLERLLALPGLGRLRLSGIEPMAFSERIIDVALNHPKLCPHFHLPLQSGSDRILKRMGRPYRAEAYVKLAAQIKAALPEVCLGTDLIVGFPGETEAEFEDSLAVIRAAGIDHLHVFSYSDRSGAPAAKLKNKTDPRAIKARSQAARALGEAQWQAFLARNLGSFRDVLRLGQHEGPLQLGLADNYLPVLCAPGPEGSRERLRITEIDGARVRA